MTKRIDSLPTVNSTIKVSSWLRYAAERLQQFGIEDPQLEATVLLAKVVQRDRSWLLAHPEYVLSEAEDEAAGRLLQRRLGDEPLPYILGEWEFYGRNFLVSPAALIPRPESELIVEEALQWIQAHPGEKKLWDVGTGTGILAATLALECKNLTVTASDISLPALALAARNIQRLGLTDRIRLLHNDLLADVTDHVDIVVANLPYIPGGDADLAERIRNEPRLALDGGDDGMKLLLRLLHQCVEVICKPGLILLEMDYRQGARMREFARILIPLSRVDVIKDLAGLDRVLRIEVL